VCSDRSQLNASSPAPQGLDQSALRLEFEGIGGHQTSPVSQARLPYYCCAEWQTCPIAAASVRFACEQGWGPGVCRQIVEIVNIISGDFHQRVLVASSGPRGHWDSRRIRGTSRALGIQLVNRSYLFATIAGLGLLARPNQTFHVLSDSF
jgi:hypothetical protein